MQFLGLKSKENIFVFILKKKQQQEQQPKAFYNEFLFRLFFNIVSRNGIYLCAGTLLKDLLQNK